MRAALAASMVAAASAFGAVAAVGGAASAAAALAPVVTLSPAVGTAGSAFSITFSGFYGEVCPTVWFYWDDTQQEIASAVSYQKTPVVAHVPAGAAPGRHYVHAMSCYSVVVPFDVVPPATSPPPAPTTTVSTPPRPQPTSQPTTVKPPGGPAPTPPPPSTGPVGAAATTPVTSSATAPASTAASEPAEAATTTGEPGARLVFDKPSVQAGEPLSATGTGCDPLATVDLTSGGERVGAAVADAAGGFTTPVELSRVVPGRHVVTASCGVLLTGAVDVVLTSSTSGNTGTLAVLVFFVLAAFTLVARPRGRRTR
jgi:hypothetical protein